MTIFPLNPANPSSPLVGEMLALDVLTNEIAYLERRFLDDRGIAPKAFRLENLAGLSPQSSQNFLSIQGLADFWSTHAEIDFGRCMTDLVVATHNQSRSHLVLVLFGNRDRLSVFISLGNQGVTRVLLEGIIPGIDLIPVPGPGLVPVHCSDFKFKGVISGIPSRKTSSNNFIEKQGLSQLERVVRGMQGATWGYIVRAYPCPRETVFEKRKKVMDQLIRVASRSRIPWQETAQGSVQEEPDRTVSTSRTYGGEFVNYPAQYLLQLLERELERCDRAIMVGQWTVDILFGADTTDNAQRLASLLLGTLSGSDSRPEPLRAHLYLNNAGISGQNKELELKQFQTYLSSDEVATLIQLPREEVPGYAIHDFVRFDVDFRPPNPKHISLALGHIQQNGKSTEPYRIRRDDLAKHAIIAGVTGSGKTTSILNILDHANKVGIPFLVIEPAKQEYRALRSTLDKSKRVRVYTLGNEKVAPFRFNPFEFETTNNPDFSGSVLNHIDFLKAVFNAAFVLYPPMPYVLETALYEIYEDKGWDLADNRNKRLLNWAKRKEFPIFPTLTDLYLKIEEVTSRLRYSSEVERDVIAGLKARVGTLRLGSKGLMLDTSHGIPLQQLLSYPTILELDSIGNDDEKTFLMGLFLARLYEYRRLQGLSEKLEHLLVFEEAHRLLKKTKTELNDVESVNPRAQAIETFTNMLSEIRGYGQGIIVAEQIPEKLAPDVLKNTNLKVVHRLVAADDRMSIGQTMNLNEAQRTHLGILSPGAAVVYAEGNDHAYLVQMENYKSAHNLSPPTDNELAKASGEYTSITPYGGRDTEIYQMAGKLLETQESKHLWARLLLRAVFNDSALPTILTNLRQQIDRERPNLQSYEKEELVRIVIERGCAEMLSLRGTESGWSYESVEHLRELLTKGLKELLLSGDNTRASEYLDQFARRYQQERQREEGPFVGCEYCPAKCLYRLEVRHLLSERYLRTIEDRLEDLPDWTNRDDYTNLAEVARGIGAEWLGKSDATVPAVGYCGILHASVKLEWSEQVQAMIGENLPSQLFL